MQDAVTKSSFEAFPVLEATGNAIFVVSREGALLWQSHAGQTLTLHSGGTEGGGSVDQALRLVTETGESIEYWRGLTSGAVEKLAGTGILVNRHGAEFPVQYSAATAAIGVVLAAVLRAPEPLEAPAEAAVEEAASVEAEGLRTKSDAEMAIRQCVECGERKCAAVFSVDRLALYRSRYGPAAARQLKADYAQHLCHLLRSGDEIYEWGTPGFLILLRRDGQEDDMREELKRIASRRLDCTLKGSTAIISLQAQWNLKPLYGDESAEDLIAELEQFTAS